ncbi:Gfo/Idh/MocA family protein [Streptomyces boncukensis]|uniref:Gfo/Idh/MocA family oxidoreductase n=1 Tax=Streptomyces boncukensis TaxID=2711219 RepID=A0A6G4WXL7_9ACTN|nr:Gfo/Idh/MocA family oxidoreductase [Streptomyces boncukensis]NGO69357.1 Gfo/Idh/MocA family oxidoreductase [Streptomyces boncukensis]
MADGGPTGRVPAGDGRGPTEPDAPLRVVLAGAHGHGRTHLHNIRRLERAGVARLAGVCELRPLSAEELAGPPVPQSDDLGALLDRTGAQAAVLCTPIHTHLELASTVARRGVHQLLEKPPTPSRADFEALVETVRGTGTACQIGFQSFGSHALDTATALVEQGAIGAVRGVGAAGAWVRDDAYWRRVPWAGHRTLHGRDVMDGVLTNPLAHAVATALRLARADRAEDVRGLELELYRANPIEADDTSCVRVRTAAGTDVTAAVTLCAEESSEPYVVVHGERGRITFWYKQDELLVEREGHSPRRSRHGRTDLLENLAAHLADGTPLLAPPERTGAFMRLVEAVRTAPPPHPIPPGAWKQLPGRRTVPGVDGLTAAGAETLALYSELHAPWAVPPLEVTVP